MSDSPELRADSDEMDPRIWRITSVVLLGPLMSSLDSTVVNVSLLALGRELHVPLTTIQWVTTGYLLALALMLPLTGWLVDRIGAKRVYLGCFTAFTLASLLCGLANSAGALIGARVLQGMAGGLIAPMAQMMTARAAGRHLAKVMGLMVVPVLLGPICGPTLAGVILEHASWRWIFFINLPIGVLATGLAAWILPDDVASARPRSFDVTGFLLLSPGLVLLLDSLESLGANRANGGLRLVELAVAAVLLGCFVPHARRLGGRALVDVGLFRNRTFAAAACTQFLANSIAFGGQMLLPLYLLSVEKIPATEVGMLLASAGLGMLCSYPLMGTLTERYGSRRVSAAGGFISLMGTLPFAVLAVAGVPRWGICVALFVRGAGMGCIGIPSIAAAYASVAKETLPVATTAINIVQRLGGPMATTALATFLHVQSAAVGARTGGWDAEAFGATFWLLCGVHVAAIVSALRLPLFARRAAAEVEGGAREVEAVRE